MIPRILHQVWVGPPMPEHLAAWCEAWRRLHPDWEYRLWGEDDLGWLENRDLYDAAEEWSPRNLGAFRSDIARIEILHREGGVYADCDMEPRRPIDQLLTGCSAFTFKHPTPNGKPKPNYPWLTNALIGAEPGHPAYRAAIDGMAANCEANRGLRVIFTTGVRYLTSVWMGRDDMRVYPSEWAYPYGLLELDRAGEEFPDAYAVHHWNNRRSGGYVEDAA